MTEIEALEKSIIQWEWLWDNPCRNKYDYFMSNDIDIKEVPFWCCYLCEYSYNHDEGELDCSKCPVWEWSSVYIKNGAPPCTLESSPYMLWCYSYNIPETKEGSEDMLTLLKKNLERVRNKSI